MTHPFHTIPSGGVAIEAVDLSIGYRRRSEVRTVGSGISLRLMCGEVTCLLGQNGAGKSTLLRTLCGFQPPIGGEVRLMGLPLESYPQSSFSRTVGVVLTEKTNAGGISVYELVSLGRHPYTGFFGQLGEEDHRIIQEAMESAGIASKASNYVSELSDGERQKAMIAKALAQQCPIIVLDEPTAFLDVTSRIETMALLRRLAEEQGKAVLLSTHDMDSAIQMADRIWLQRPGEDPIRCGTPEELILSGEFGRYFDRGMINFDQATGKLYAAVPGTPVGVDGEPLTAFWMGNALARAGFRPSAPDQSHPRAVCHGKGRIEVIFPDGAVTVLTSVPEAVSLLKKSAAENS